MMRPACIYIPNTYPNEPIDIFSGDDRQFLEKEPWSLFILPRFKAEIPVVQPLKQSYTLSHELFINSKKKRKALVSPWTLTLSLREITSQYSKGVYPNLYNVLHAVGEALHVKRMLKQFIQVNNLISRPIVVYTFWFSPAVIGACLLRRIFPQIRVVTRLHGADLYAHRVHSGYLPFRFLRKAADVLAPCSQQGADYLVKEGIPASKISTCYLGAPHVVGLTPSTAGKNLTIASCSFVTAVKRLPLMAQSFLAFASRCPDVVLHWHHVGGGPHLEALKAMMSATPPNLTCTFHGGMKVDESRQFFQGHETNGLDGLINVSESEGLPVSMMEAQMAGLPVIGTDVGGVSEIVRPDTGILLPKDFTQDQFDSAVLRLRDWKKTEIREHIAQKARDRFSLDNYKNFIDEGLWPQMRLSQAILEGSGPSR
jgi:glycosyltransferase involved in cell wall biosynthesis